MGAFEADLSLFSSFVNSLGFAMGRDEKYL